MKSLHLFGLCVLLICICLCESAKKKKKNNKGDKNDEEKVEKEKETLKLDRIYTFAFSNDGFPTNYVDGGQIIGHSIDFTHEFCKYAGKQCETVLVQRKQCWDSSGGFPPFSTVLNRRYFSSCASFQISPERNMTYDFGGESYFNSPVPSIITSKKSNIVLEDLEECNEYKLAYPANTVLEPDCLLDSGYFVRERNYVPVVTSDDFQLSSIMAAVIEKVVTGEAELGLVLTRFARTDEVRILKHLSCSNQIQTGLNNMFRKDDTDLTGWWSENILKFLCSNKYKEFCENLVKSDKYAGADPLCRVPGEDLDCSKVGGPAAKPPKADSVKRINPCISEVCRERQDLNYNTFREDFYLLIDVENRKPEKALDGNEGDTYSGVKKQNVVFTIKAKDNADDVVFRPDKLCLTVKNVREIKFVFKGGSKVAETRGVLVNFQKEWTTICESDAVFRKNVRIELTITKKFVRFGKKKDEKIRVKEMFLNGCTKKAFVTE